MEQAFLGALNQTQIIKDAPMRAYTTFRIGGPADYLLLPNSEEQIRAILGICAQHDYPLTVIGAGSNLLVGDKGVRGAVLRIGEGMRAIEHTGSGFIAQAGAQMTALSAEAARRGLSGLEFAAGIPGAVGGALAMNAGAYGGEIKDVVANVCALTYKGESRAFNREQMRFSYRHSRLMEEKEIAVRAEFSLTPGDPKIIRARMAEYAAARREKQPLQYPSAGSAFTRPPGYFAAALIDGCCLKGLGVGDAQVSEKHCGFIINKGSATASDVRALIELVQHKVLERTGVALTPEIRFVGEF